MNLGHVFFGFNKRHGVKPYVVLRVQAGNALSQFSVFGNSDGGKVDGVHEVLLIHHNEDLAAHGADVT